MSRLAVEVRQFTSFLVSVIFVPVHLHIHFRISSVYRVLFIAVLFFETGFFYIALVVLEFSM